MLLRLHQGEIKRYLILGVVCVVVAFISLHQKEKTTEVKVNRKSNITAESQSQLHTVKVSGKKVKVKG